MLRVDRRGTTHPQKCRGPRGCPRPVRAVRRCPESDVDFDQGDPARTCLKSVAAEGRRSTTGSCLSWMAGTPFASSTATSPNTDSRPDHRVAPTGLQTGSQPRRVGPRQVEGGRSGAWTSAGSTLTRDAIRPAKPAGYGFGSGTQDFTCRSGHFPPWDWPRWMHDEGAKPRQPGSPGPAT